MSDDCVSKFTSLVIARDHSSLPKAPGGILSFCYSDSDTCNCNVYLAVQAQL